MQKRETTEVMRKDGHAEEGDNRGDEEWEKLGDKRDEDQNERCSSSEEGATGCIHIIFDHAYGWLCCDVFVRYGRS